MQNVKNLIIDFGGVIINLTRNLCIDSFERLGVTDVREQITNNYQHKDLFMQLELGSITTTQFRDGIRRLSGHPLTDDQIDEAWVNMLADVPGYRLDLLLDLKKRYHTVLLSNTNEIHWKWAEQHVFSYQGHHIDDFFDHIYLSYELHMLKPNADIFEHVLKDQGFKAAETLFIDDALPNCRTAESLGLQTYMPAPQEDWSAIFR